MIYEFRMWMVSVLMGWLCDVAPKERQGLIVVLHLRNMAGEMGEATRRAENGALGKEWR